jgi:hypothetical protein
MISTLVENSISFPFVHISGNDSKPKFYHGTHIHLISFVKGTETVYITFLSWRNEVLRTVESGGAFLDIRVVLGH